MQTKSGRKRPLLLDLYCGEGGGALGYCQAGFDVIGMDIFRQPRYPYTFIRGNALKPKVNINMFDAIHASPPCQLFSPMARQWTHVHQNLIPATLDLLAGFDGLWVVENVEGAAQWLPGAVQVCGTATGCFIDTPYRYAMRRHRLFMSNAPLKPTECLCREFKQKGYKFVSVMGHSAGGRGFTIR